MKISYLQYILIVVYNYKNSCGFKGANKIVKKVVADSSRTTRIFGYKLWVGCGLFNRVRKMGCCFQNLCDTKILQPFVFKIIYLIFYGKYLLYSLIKEILYIPQIRRKISKIKLSAKHKSQKLKSDYM